MDVQSSVRPWTVRCGEIDPMKVRARACAACGDIAHTLIWHKFGDAPLGLLRATSDMRRDENTRKTLEQSEKRFFAILPLVRKYVNRCAGDFAALEVLRKHLDIYNVTPAQVQEEHPVVHQGEFFFIDDIRISRIPVDMDRDDICHLQEILESRRSRGIAYAQLIHRTVVVDGNHRPKGSPWSGCREDGHPPDLGQTSSPVALG